MMIAIFSHDPVSATWLFQAINPYFTASIVLDPALLKELSSKQYNLLIFHDQEKESSLGRQDIDPTFKNIIFLGQNEMHTQLLYKNIFYPCKPSHLLKTIDLALLQYHQEEKERSLLIGYYKFYPADFILEESTGIQKTLTEKERDILLFLYQKNGVSVPRQQLLDQVWGHNNTLETHTLETHIYRLRQKIEADPAQPVFLVTKLDGYCLNF